MKLHLPKMLLTAVLAAVTLAPAWGGQWVANGDGNEDCYTFTGENDATSLDTTGHIFNNAVWVRAGANELSPTLSELLLGNGAKLNITGTWKNTVNEFTLLTISSLKIGADGAGTGSLEIAGNANTSLLKVLALVLALLAFYFFGEKLFEGFGAAQTPPQEEVQPPVQSIWWPILWR